MAAPMENEIEENQSNQHFSSNRYSSKARDFARKTSPKEDSLSFSHLPPRSFSLDLMQEKDFYSKSGDNTKICTTPVMEMNEQSSHSNASMKLNYNSTSLADRLRAIPPSHSGIHGVSSLLATDNVEVSLDPYKRFEFVEYEDIDSEQKNEFEKLLKKESGCARSWLHKGLIANIAFLAIMIIGIILGEVFFPLEGIRGSGITLGNDTMCTNNTGACYAVRIARAVGVFGFLGGVTNWIGIEMLFRTIPFMIGTGVFAKKYKEIRESIKRMVVESLFDPVALRLYFTGRKKSLREIFQLENHFGGLLSSDATSKIVDKKIDSLLARPEGFILTMMGVSHDHLRGVLKKHIHSFISDISPYILDKISSSGLSDGVGIQAEVCGKITVLHMIENSLSSLHELVERILEQKTEELGSNKIRQLMSLMIRKHLNWLIIWGNILGAVAGLVAEVVAIVVARYTDT